MHKAHFMSQTISRKITTPIGLIPVVWQRDRIPVTKREFLENPGSTPRVVEVKDRYELFDPWELRDAFLGWRTEDWQAFFFYVGRGWSGSAYIAQSDFAEWQQLLREALLRPAREWRSLTGQYSPEKVAKLTGPLRIFFDWQRDVPAAMVVLPDSLTAIIATIQVDALQGAEYRVCARHDCKSAPFRVEARQKIYCSSDCAHLVAVRQSRERAAKKGKRKNRRGRG